jgi:diguanylate cyclase (GGDEF)-like protein
LQPGLDTRASIHHEVLRWSSRLIAAIEALLLILVLLSLTFQGVDADDQSAILTGLLFYAALVTAMRYADFRDATSRWTLAIETWAMIPFVAWVMWFTDKLASPLHNAFLLTIITSALTLGMRTTLLQLAAIAACVVLLGEPASAGAVFSVSYFSSLVTHLTPLIVVAYVTAMFSSEIRYGMRKAKAPMNVDQLTGAYNMLGFTIMVDPLFAHSVRHNFPASLLVIDVDKLETINDAHGYETGNAVLQAVAGRIRAVLRHNDVLARSGGDEFVALLPHTSSSGAMEVAGRIRDAVAGASIAAADKSLAVSVSIGVASLAEDGAHIDAIVARANHAMYLAKEQGRNRVVKLAA